jgi:hypothetical protein
VADAGGFEIHRRGGVVVLPDGLGPLLETLERAVKLITVRKTHQVGWFGGRQNHHPAHPKNRELMNHFS